MTFAEIVAGRLRAAVWRGAHSEPDLLAETIEVERMSPTIAMLEKLALALEIDLRDFLPAPRRRQPKRRG